jgi:hypothetical protein
MEMRNACLYLCRLATDTVRLKRRDDDLPNYPVGNVARHRLVKTLFEVQQLFGALGETAKMLFERGLHLHFSLLDELPLEGRIDGLDGQACRCHKVPPDPTLLEQRWVLLYRRLLHLISIPCRHLKNIPIFSGLRPIQ